MNTKIVLAVVAMVGLLVLGACGGDSPTSHTPTDSTVLTESQKKSEEAVDIVADQQPDTIEQFCASLSIMNEDAAHEAFMQGWNEDNVGEDLNVDPDDLFDAFVARCD